ncbi:PAS domain-containing protein [Phenylobacterium sp.]|uniref:hybrid sensor histidine kinase/response regulator n=1 Tax=Phenylobacterium sp. TaxID=1871053 RepID=UPI002899E130|nr:PAS domain-containing protein [Phenylobacterium sp.]
MLRAAAGMVMAAPPNYMTFYPAVLFATLVAGARGGLAATLASAVLVWSFWLGGSPTLFTAIFIATATATVLIGQAIRIAVLRGVEAEKRFRIFQEHAREGFIIVEPVYEGGRLIDFRCAYSNPAAEAMARADIGGLQGRRILDVLSSENGQLMFDRLAAVYAAGGSDDIEVRRVIEGQVRFLRSSAVRLPQGLAVTFRDITAQRQSENALRTGEARVRALLDSLPQLIWSARGDGYCDFLSPQWVEFTGVAPEQHYGAGWQDAIHPEDRDAVAQAWNQAVGGGLPYDVEFRLRRCDGVWRWVKARASAVRNDEGRVHRWFGTTSDISEVVEARAELEERVAARTRELERSLAERAQAEAALAQAQRLETVGRLTGGVAHDFNNLLTVVIGGLDMILQHPQDTSRVSRLAEAALAAGRRGEQLVRQLMAFSRRQELKLELVDVSGLIEEIEPLVRRAVGEDVNLTIRREGLIGSSRLDPAQFEAALLNLVVNAADAAPNSGGDIEIALQRRRLADGEVPGAAAGDYVSVAVSDNGAGMTPDILERAFEPFFTTKDVGKGTGLGLAQVYGFIKQVGGAAAITSSIGAGATVTLYLPAAEAQAANHAAPLRTNEGEWARGARVLLVEDDAAVRAVTESLLIDFGCRVEGACDGPSALGRLQAGERFDLLISDIVMPGGMSGVDLARAARARDARLPIVLTSGYAGERLGEGAEALAWPLLRKPFRAEQLGVAVREALQRNQVEA